MSSKDIKGFKVYSTIASILWPFGAVGLAIKYHRQSWAKNIVWIFVIFYAFSMAISSDGVDAARYRDFFIRMVNHPIDLRSLFKLMYSGAQGYFDIIRPLLTFIVSRVCNDYRFLFLVFGLIFGYFYSRNIWLLIDQAGSKIRFFELLLILTFASIVGFWGINGWRFWTATLVFFYGVYSYIVLDNKKGLAIAATSILFHFSFLFPLSILIVYILLGNKVQIYFYFLLVTLFISGIDLLVLRGALSFLPEILQIKVQTYTNTIDSDIEMISNMVWYVRYRNIILKWLLLIFALLIFYFGRNVTRTNKKLLSLFSFSLLFFGMANIAVFVSSGSRFIAIANLFMLAVVFIFIQQAHCIKLFRWAGIISIPVLLFYIVVAIRVSFTSVGIMTVFGNYISVFFVKNDFPIIELIKRLIVIYTSLL